VVVGPRLSTGVHAARVALGAKGMYSRQRKDLLAIRCVMPFFFRPDIVQAPLSAHALDTCQDYPWPSEHSGKAPLPGGSLRYLLSKIAPWLAKTGRRLRASVLC